MSHKKGIKFERGNPCLIPIVSIMERCFTVVMKKHKHFHCATQVAEVAIFHSQKGSIFSLIAAMRPALC